MGRLLDLRRLSVKPPTKPRNQFPNQTPPRLCPRSGDGHGSALRCGDTSRPPRPHDTAVFAKMRPMRASALSGRLEGRSVHSVGSPAVQTMASNQPVADAGPRQDRSTESLRPLAPITTISRLAGASPTDRGGIRNHDVGPRTLPLGSDVSRALLQAFAATNRRLMECLEQKSKDAQTITRLRRDLSSALGLVAAAEHRANHDPLTGLPNRRLLSDRLDQALSHAAQIGGQIGLLLLDLNGFKHVNDVLGHVAGDEILIRVAHMLRTAVRAGDTVCRFGGDEFVVLLPDIEQKRLVTSIATKIQQRLRLVAGSGDAIARIAASVGYALYPAHGQSAAELLQHADRAMYESRVGAVVVRPPWLPAQASAHWRAKSGDLGNDPRRIGS